jgi:hypothetical protein
LQEWKKNQESISSLKKQHLAELTDLNSEALRVRAGLEQEVLVLKEMIKSVNMQLKSKDIDIERLNIKIKRLQTIQQPQEVDASESTQAVIQQPLVSNKVLLPPVKPSVDKQIASRESVPGKTFDTTVRNSVGNTTQQRQTPERHTASGMSSEYAMKGRSQRVITEALIASQGEMRFLNSKHL